MTYDPTKPVSSSNPPPSRGEHEPYEGELQTDGVTDKKEKAKKNKPVGPAEPVIETVPAGRRTRTVDTGA